MDSYFWAVLYFFVFDACLKSALPTLWIGCLHNFQLVLMVAVLEGLGQQPQGMKRALQNPFYRVSEKVMDVVTLNFHDHVVLLHWKYLKMLIMQDFTEWMLNITWLVHTLKTRENDWNVRFFFHGLESPYIFSNRKIVAKFQFKAKRLKLAWTKWKSGMDSLWCIRLRSRRMVIMPLYQFLRYAHCGWYWLCMKKYFQFIWTCIKTGLFGPWNLKV